MRTYIITLTLAVVVTVATFGTIDWWQEAEPQPVAYCEKVVRWIGGLSD